MAFMTVTEACRKTVDSKRSAMFSFVGLTLHGMVCTVVYVACAVLVATEQASHVLFHLEVLAPC